jgi:putative membrane protein
MRTFLLRWIINGLALGVAVWLVPGIVVDGGWQVIAATALIFGFVNAIIRPILTFLTCPLVILTLGLFTLVINALMLQLAAWLSNLLELGFYVDGFWAAFWGALIISLVSGLLSLLVREEPRSITSRYHGRR